ncbi:13659_t:CDS:1, partial [Racocetra fulgida]
ENNTLNQRFISQQLRREYKQAKRAYISLNNEINETSVNQRSIA